MTASIAEQSVVDPDRSNRCTAVYDGQFWVPSRCREDIDHNARDHIDRYRWEGVDYGDSHAPHGHHVDGLGRTWGAAS